MGLARSPGLKALKIGRSRQSENAGKCHNSVLWRDITVHSNSFLRVEQISQPASSEATLTSVDQFNSRSKETSEPLLFWMNQHFSWHHRIDIAVQRKVPLGPPSPSSYVSFICLSFLFLVRGCFELSMCWSWLRNDQSFLNRANAMPLPCQLCIREQAIKDCSSHLCCQISTRLPSFTCFHQDPFLLFLFACLLVSFVFTCVFNSWGKTKNLDESNSV